MGACYSVHAARRRLVTRARRRCGAHPALRRRVRHATRSHPSRFSAETAARERAYGFRAGHRFRHAIDGFAARLTAEDARALRADPEVALVSPDRKLHAARVARRPGRDRSGPASRASAVADRPESMPRAAPRLPSSTPASTSPTLIWSLRPGPTAWDSGPPEDDDVDGHGTFVAGVIGARNAGAGVVGVAPGTQLYAVKVLDALGDGWVHQVICGIDWVTANAKPLGIRVANMSLSQELQDDALHLAVKRSAESRHRLHRRCRQR